MPHAPTDDAASEKLLKPPPTAFGQQFLALHALHGSILSILWTGAGQGSTKKYRSRIQSLEFGNLFLHV
jgi:hypothetical protein